MAKRGREPFWLTRTVIDSVHTDQIREHGGLAGVRDENVLESALGRPLNKRFYDSEDDLAVLAAAYGFAIISSHPYRDGNKRIGFLAIATFLWINDHDFDASETDVVTTILAVAAGHISEDQLADWIRGHMTPAAL